MNRSKILTLVFVIIFIGVFTLLFNSMRSCVVGLNWRSALQPGTIKLCFISQNDLPAGQVRWNRDIQLGTYGFIGSIWIRNAVILDRIVEQEGLTLIVGYNLSGNRRILKSKIKNFVNFSVDSSGGEGDSQIVDAKSLESKISPGDVISIGLTFLPKRSPITIDGYREYYSKRFEGEDLKIRLEKITSYDNHRFEESEIESILGREFVNLENTGILVGTISKERVK